MAGGQRAGRVAPRSLPGRVPKTRCGSTIARDWQRALFDGGWAAISWPREHGGRGATVIERWLFEEQLDRVGAPRPIASSGAVDLIGSALLHHGTEAQRARFMKPLLAGGDLWCQGFSEPGAGSDLGFAAHPRRARRRRLRRQRPEGVDQPRRHRRLVLPPVPHRARGRRSTRASACCSSTCARPASACGR